MTRPLALAIATAGYIGYSPVVPGTIGSALGLLVLWAIRLSGSASAEVGLLLVVVVAGVWAAGVAESHFGREDPSAVVVDEVAGMLVTLWWVPLTWTTALVGFFLFRLLDIVKPFPARDAERLPRGWGIMTDDLIAGAYSWLGVHAVIWLVSTVIG